MKKAFLVALVGSFAFVSPARAQKAGDAGAGLIVGNPTGVTGKLWLTNSSALDAGLGFSTRFAVYGDYLWHSWMVLPQPKEGRLPVYFGLGLQARTFHDAELGVRVVAGAAYWLPKNPVELFVEFVPVFRLTPGASLGLDAGLGLRYYFRG